MSESVDGKRTKQQQREVRRAYWQSVFSWGTVLTAIAGFFTIWHSMNHAPSGQASQQSTNTPAVQAAGSIGVTPRRHHHRFSDNGNPNGSGGAGFFSDGNSGQGSAGISPNPEQTPDFGSSAS